MARVVYTGIDCQHELKGSLFEGQKFWFSQKVPQRKWFMEQVESNGGVVVPLEKQADIKLVDHKRKDLPPDTYSYQYVEFSIRKGQLEELEDHAAGPPAGTIRSVGSTTMPAKGTRNYYTREDDQALWDWITTHERKGGYLKGNEIYKQLEEVNPRHPWQSWRDRWIKTLSSRPRPTQRPEDISHTPTSSPERRMKDEPARTRAIVSSSHEKHKFEFTKDDAMLLLEHVEDILDIETGRSQEAWEAWAKANPEHNARQWQDFFEKRVRPAYEKKVKRYTGQQVKSVKHKSLSSPQTSLNPKKSRGETSLMVSPLPSRTKKAISPELESQFPSLRSTRPAIPQSPERHGQPRNLPSMSFDYDGKGSTIVPISPKRKRDSVGEIASSSPLKPETPALNKRPRYKETGGQITEIPSTPERGATPIAFSSPSPSYNLDEVVDLEVEDDVLGAPASQSLSEPDRSGQTTTSHPEPPLTLNYDLPSPEGGWNSDDVLPALSPDLSTTQKQQDTTEDTQQLLIAQTQIPDLSVPEPDGGWDTLLGSLSLPNSPSQSHPTPTTTDSNAVALPQSDNHTNSNSDTTELRAWIEKHLQRNMPSNLIIKALKSTTMDPMLAKAVLDLLVQGKGIPNDVAGVWTEQDDEDLRGNDGRRIKRVTEKHGTKAFEERWEFLEEWDGV